MCIRIRWCRSPKQILLPRSRSLWYSETFKDLSVRFSLIITIPWLRFGLRRLLKQALMLKTQMLHWKRETFFCLRFCLFLRNCHRRAAELLWAWQQRFDTKPCIQFQDPWTIMQDECIRFPFVGSLGQAIWQYTHTVLTCGKVIITPAWITRPSILMIVASCAKITLPLLRSHLHDKRRTCRMRTSTRERSYKKLLYCRWENKKLWLVKNVDNPKQHYNNILWLSKRECFLVYFWLIHCAHMINTQFFQFNHYIFIALVSPKNWQKVQLSIYHHKLRYTRCRRDEPK